MLRTLKNNKKGVVFVTVLMIIIVMTIITLSIISMNVSQVKSSENEIRRIQSDALAQGAWAITYTSKLNNINASIVMPPLTDPNCSWTSPVTTAGTGINNTDNIAISTNCQIP